MSILETFQSFSIGPSTSSAASKNDQLSLSLGALIFFPKSNSGRLLCMLMTWPGLTIETPSGVPPWPCPCPWFYSGPFITLPQHLHFNMILPSSSQLFLSGFDSRQDCWENILSWIEKLRYVCWQCGENVFSFQWKKLNSADDQDDCWKARKKESIKSSEKDNFCYICFIYAGPAVHSIVVWRDVLILTFLPAS